MKTLALAPLLLLPLLLLLLLLLPPLHVCLRSNDLRNPSYIQIWSNTQQWHRRDARKLCRSNFTNLVAIRTEEENQWLVTFEGGIGLGRSNPGRVWRWLGEENATFFSWDSGHPTDGWNCASKKSNSDKWMSRNCHNWDSFICYEDRVILVKEEKTWEEALAHCRALVPVDSVRPAQDLNNHRYDLATLLHPGDIDFARKKAEGGTTDEVWTGLRFIAGHWLWVDGEPVQVGQQIPAEPTQGSLNSCGALRVQSTDSIQARDCALRKNFLCYKKFHDQVIEIVE